MENEKLKRTFSSAKIEANNEVCLNDVVIVEREQSLLLSATEAAKLLGVGSSHFWGLHSNGRLGPIPIKLGRRTLWNRQDLEKWVDAGCPSRKMWIKMNGNTN